VKTRLLIHYRGPGAALTWLTEDERGRVLSGPSTAQSPPQTARQAAQSIYVLVPAEAVWLSCADVPARTREQLQRALPFAVEDQLAEAVEALHVAAVRHADGRQWVAVVAPTRLQTWMADLRTRGIEADALIADSAALPRDAQRLVLLLDGTRALAQLPDGRAFACAADELPNWLAQIDAPRDADGRVPITLYGDGDDANFVGLGVSVQHGAGDEAPLRVFARGVRAQAAPNLLSGAYVAQHRGASARRWWRIAAVLAAAALVLSMARVAYANWQLSRQLAELDARMQAVYREVYPEGRMVPNPAERMRADLGAGGTGMDQADALGLLGKVAPVLTASTQYSLNAIDYRNGVLELGLIGSGLSALDGVRESLAGIPGLQAELASATSNDIGSEGRVRVQERTP
jgi:general secretion pathway protein L